MTPRSTSIILGAPLNLNTQFMSSGRARRCGPAQGRDDSGYAERAFETCFFHTRGITTVDRNSPFSAIPANASASTRSRSLPWFRPRSDGPTKYGNCGRLCPSHSARLDAAENVGVCWSLHALVESQNRPVSERPRIASNLLSPERHASKSCNGGLEFLIGLIRTVIVGSRPAPCVYRNAANRWLMMIGAEAAPRSPDVEQDCHMNPAHGAGLFGEGSDDARSRMFDRRRYSAPRLCERQKSDKLAGLPAT